MFETLTVLLSSILITVFNIIFQYELKSLKKGNSSTSLSALVPKIMKLLIKIYRNIPSTFIALIRLDPSCQLTNPSFKLLTRSFSISDARCLEPNLTQVITILPSASYSKSEAIIMHLLQQSMGETQGKFFTTSIRSVMTLVLTSIIMAPIPMTLLAIFYGDNILNLLPLIASLLYGVYLQLTFIVLRRYIKLLV